MDSAPHRHDRLRRDRGEDGGRHCQLTARPARHGDGHAGRHWPRIWASSTAFPGPTGSKISWPTPRWMPSTSPCRITSTRH